MSKMSNAKHRSQNSEARSQNSEACSQNSEASGPKPVTRSQKSEVRRVCPSDFLLQAGYEI
ncbi:MAG: hypothetical protein FWH55_13990 [Oscillospiraceae bacterium]|nr:hypothetical protein [Oscillospiraceae bacterium]